MSTVIYSTIPDYDVSVYATSNGLVCAMCNFGDYIEMAFQAESTQEMIDHLLAHERKGDILPQNLVETVQRDDLVNYPQNPSVFDQ